MSSLPYQTTHSEVRRSEGGSKNRPCLPPHFSFPQFGDLFNGRGRKALDWNEIVALKGMDFSSLRVTWKFWNLLKVLFNKDSVMRRKGEVKQ